MNRAFQVHKSILICVAFILLINVQLFAQGSKELVGLKAIPTPLRVRLHQKLKLYVEYESKRKYEQLYDLFSEATIKNFNHRDSIVKTKSDYIKWRQNSYPILLTFKPLSVSYDSTLGAYEIRGEAKLRWKGGVAKHEGFIYATLQNNDWYFSQVFEKIDELYPEPEPIKVTPIQIIKDISPQ